MAIPASLSRLLEKNAIAHEVLEHRTVFTAYDLAQTLGMDLPSIAKTMLLKTNDGFVLVVVPSNKHVDIPKVKKAAMVSKISIATEKDMASKLKIKPGALTPFGSVYHAVVIVDTGIAKQKKIVVGAGSFTESLLIKPKDLITVEKAVVAAVSVAPKKPYKIQPKPAKGRSASGRKKAVPKRQAKKHSAPQRTRTAKRKR